ncbi:DNA-3-methyladenine glycosylase-like [Miscanthus floridulus]|uniref:DNA-3-methyladenine glycosylase-like n=1 Tax=Miscanthus floridulus TaxID=154761 RepID=UPI003459205E
MTTSTSGAPQAPKLQALLAQEEVAAQKPPRSPPWRRGRGRGGGEPGVDEGTASHIGGVGRGGRRLLGAHCRETSSRWSPRPRPPPPRQVAAARRGRPPHHRGGGLQPNDSACHGRFGVTARTAPVFGPGGHAYVYLCYGLHMMLNVVADIEGVGAAVLIRSCSPVSGLETIQRRRGQQTEKPILLTGPGKVGQALGLSTDWSNHPLYTPGGLEVLDGPEPESVLVGPRVGIDYASPEHVAAPWRFAIAGTPWISAPKNTLRPR